MTARIDVDVALKRDGFELKARFQSDDPVTAVFGRSGGGKTTLIDCIAGLARPDAGRIVIDGAVLFDAEQDIYLPPERRRVGYVFQDARLFPHMNVKQNLLYGRPRSTAEGLNIRPDEIFGLLGLDALLDRRPGALSGGEKQRVAIGRALLSGPRLLLMDEPLAALDVDRKSEILPFIEKLRDQFELPILYVSHSVDEVVRLADNMIVLADGQSIATGDVEDIMSRLDLRPHTGRFEAGAVINVWVVGHDDVDQLTELSFGAGSIWVPRLEYERSTPLRLRLRARDVWLSTDAPSNSAVLNTFPGTVVDFEDVDASQSPHVDVLINIGAPIISRIARRALRDLRIAKGQQLFVSIKTASIDRHSLGLSRRRQ